MTTGMAVVPEITRERYVREKVCASAVPNRVLPLRRPAPHPAVG